MCDNLRKVTFKLLKDGYQPNLTQVETADKINLTRERNGFFHKWVEDVDTSGDIPCIKPMALVEDAEDGKIHFVEYYNLQFIK